MYTHLYIYIFVLYETLLKYLFSHNTDWPQNHYVVDDHDLLFCLHLKCWDYNHTLLCLGAIK